MRNKHTSTLAVHPVRRTALILLAAAFLALLGFAAAAAITSRSAEASTPPTVDGWFYATGEDAVYWPYDVSENGSVIYLYFDAPTVYIALVVDQSVNDNVFSPESNKAYTQSAGWNPAHQATRVVGSEFAEFTLACDGSPLSWTWRQDYGYISSGDWVSDNGGPAGTGTQPPSIVSASSFAMNMNYYEDDTANWNREVIGVSQVNWKSPFNPATPNDVTTVAGYPTASYETTAPFDPFYEWSMVYEWSVDLATAGCGNNPIYVITGQSHHSPAKNDDENDEFCTVEPCNQDDPLTDWGDLPDGYDTLSASGGPSHQFIANNPHLGPLVDPENDGQPNASASGDDINGAADDDGVTRNPGTPWTNGATVEIDLDVMCSGATADVAVWLDWDGNGSFEADEYYTFLNLTCNSVYTATITVPGSGDYTEGSTVHARVRIFNDETDAPGGSLDATDYGGAAANGEVEDYIWIFTPTAITLEDFSAYTLGGVHPAILLGILLVLAAAIVLVMRNVRKQVS